MRKDDNTRTPAARRQEPIFEEPIRHWANLPITPDRARELVDLITRREDKDALDALMELICGVMPNIPSDDKNTLDERSLAGRAALWHAFADTTRASNDLGAYVVGLKCAEWE
ncbi:MAG TPA: hypothetical protein VGO96_08930 [Pyrinomonadaceae bacterium]|jgi:hypothetical protein|nr:hypothetical protein [Pyrinomonadaceae bacterium]